MSYEPKEWACGDTITADDLNHIENGIAEAGGGDNLLIVNATTTDNQTVTGIDKTFDEIVDFALQGGAVVMRLVANPSGAPYANIFYLTLNNMQSDYSPSVGGGSLGFYGATTDMGGSGIALNVQTVRMQPNGDATFKSGRGKLYTP